jgi:hypothetical protein
MASDLPRQTPDRMLRDSLRVPANLADFLRDAFPKEAGHLDFASVKQVEREMIGGDWRAREADLLFEIPYLETPKQPALVAVLIEHQSDTDPLMPLRTLLLLAGYWDRVWRDWEATPRPREKLTLPPVLPVVLYTADLPWGSNRSLTQLLGPPAALHAFAPDWQPVFWNLAEHTPDQLLAGGAWMQLLTVMRVAAEQQQEFNHFLTEAIRSLNTIRETDHVRWYELLWAILNYAGWRRPIPERPAIWEIVERENPANHQEIKAMTMTIAEGLMHDGELRRLRKDITRILEIRFGGLPGGIPDQLAAISELDRLTAALEQAVLIEKLEAFSP